MNVTYVVLILFLMVAVTGVVAASGTPSDALVLSRNEFGLYTARLAVAGKRGWEVHVCVVDTGSRSLCVQIDPESGQATGKELPSHIVYGTQTARVKWRTLALKLPNQTFVVDAAVALHRTCSHKCFNVLGLATSQASPPSLVTQLRSPRFSLTLRQDTGLLKLSAPMPTEGATLPLLDSAHYMVPLVEVVWRCDGHDTVVPGNPAFPPTVLFDTGSNLLGGPGVDALRRCIDQSTGGSVVLRLGRPPHLYDFVVPESTYRHPDGSLLFDNSVHRTDTLVLGSLFLCDKRLTFDTAGRTMVIESV